jgi:hypothetical protein
VKRWVTPGGPCAVGVPEERQAGRAMAGTGARDVARASVAGWLSRHRSGASGDADHPREPSRTGGRIQVLKFADGTGMGRTDADFGGRPVSNPRQLRVLDLRHGIIRAQALTPEESLASIEQTLREP